jgi:tetratricopeptide (TPR) repeat protein
MALGPSVQKVHRPIVLATTMALVSAGAIGAQTQDQKSKPSSPTPGRLTGEPASQLAKLNRQIEELVDAGQFEEAMAPGREVLEIHTRLQGAEHPETVAARHNLDLFKELASVPAEGRRAIGLTFVDLRRANVLNGKKAHAEAEKIKRNVIETRRRWLGKDHLLVATGCESLAMDLRVQRRTAEAQPLHQEALEIRRKVLGEDHPDTAGAYNDLAADLYAQDQFAQAQPLFQKALDIHRRVMGEEHWNTAVFYSNVASTLEKQGWLAEEKQRRFADALPLRRRALEIYCKVLGEDHPDTAGAYNDLADNLDQQGQHGDAQPLHQKALDTFRKALGEGHPRTAAAYRKLADNVHEQGRYADAQPLFQKALDIYRKTPGEVHPATAAAYNGLANNLVSQGRYADAQPMFQKALDISRRTLGEDHESTKAVYHNLAATLASQRRFAEALPLLLKALERPPHSAMAYSTLARILDELGQYDEAWSVYQKALELNRRVNGENHRTTADIYDKLADNLENLGRFIDTMPLHQKALEIRRKVLGEDHPDTADSYSKVALDLKKQDQFADALPLNQKAMDIYRKTLGEDHHDTALSYCRTAHSLFELGRIPEAISHWTASAERFERSRRALSTSGLGRSQAAADDPRRLLALALASQGQAGEAWRRWESSLGRGLLDDLSARRLRPLKAEQRDQEVNLVGEIQQLEEQIGRLSQEARIRGQALLEYLRRRRDTVRGQLAELEQAIETQDGACGGRTASLEEIQATLPPDAALVGWLDEKRIRRVSLHWACLVAAKGAPVWVRLPGTGADGAWTESDDRCLDDLRAALVSRDPGCRELAARAARQRLAPLAPQLEGLRRLIVLPSPELTGVPVEVMLEAWKDARPLVVSYAPSGTMFAHLAKGGARRTDARKLLAVGDPLYDQPSSSSSLGPRPERGVLVTEVVYPNNWHGGIEPGDVLLSYDGREVVNTEQFKELSREAREKRRSRAQSEPFKPMVTVWRDGGTLSFVLDPHYQSMKFRRPSDLSASLQRPSLPRVPGTRPGLPRVPGTRPGLPPMPGTRPGFARRLTLPVLLDDGDEIPVPARIAEILRPLEKPSLPRLPGTRFEVLAIAELFPAADVTMLVGASATETEVQRLAKSGGLAHYRFLHFATHGTVNPDLAMSSALMLVPGPNDPANASTVPSDGRITAEQILTTWNLDAELVVFSACQSGLGRKVHGEGYLGFAQALFIKGARSLVLSQWSVSDAATALLMERFYQNLLGKRPGLTQPMPKADALDEAKRWLRNLTKDEVIGGTTRLQKRGTVTSLTPPGPSAPSQPAQQPLPTGQRPFEHPQFWAAFILIGGPN